MMNRKSVENLVEAGSGNVFADIGLPNPEEHLFKAELVLRIDQIIRRQGLSRQRAAGVLGIDRRDLSRMLDGEFRDISIDHLLRLLVSLDRDIDVVIRRKPARARRRGRVQVVAAA